MRKFIEIEEDCLCPKCGGRLCYKSMPMRLETDRYVDSSAWPKNWYCATCDKYFKEEVSDE